LERNDERYATDGLAPADAGAGRTAHHRINCLWTRDAHGDAYSYADANAFADAIPDSLANPDAVTHARANAGGGHAGQSDE
jgi:hypothetical protein